MIMQELINRTEFQSLRSAEIHKFPADRQVTFRQIKRLEAMKKFKADSIKLRAELSRLLIGRN